MSTGLIIAIVVAALLLIALFAFVLPRARRNAQVKARERELEQRRTRMAEEQRSEAAERNRQAEMAEQKARMAETEAKRERAEAELREQRAQMHEQGMADHELVDDSERDKFAGTSAVRDDTSRDEPAPMGEDRSLRSDGTTTPTGSTASGESMTGSGAATDAEGRPMHEPETDYERGREDEAAMREGRFTRDDETARTDEPARRDA